MSTCDTCRDPGACCRAFPLSLRVEPEKTADEVRAILRAGRHCGIMFDPLPFEPLRRNVSETPRQSGSVTWMFSCPKLGDDGRCTIYETRPETCRSYEPKSDALCVEFGSMAVTGGELLVIQ